MAHTTDAVEDPPPRPPNAAVARTLRTPHFPLAELPSDLGDEKIFVNLDGDYSYLSDG